MIPYGHCWRSWTDRWCGSTAVVDDFSQVLADALPLFLAVVVGLGFLVLVFVVPLTGRPLTAAATALLQFWRGFGYHRVLCSSGDT